MKPITGSVLVIIENRFMLPLIKFTTKKDTSKKCCINGECCSPPEVAQSVVLMASAAHLLRLLKVLY